MQIEILWVNKIEAENLDRRFSKTKFGRKSWATLHKEDCLDMCVIWPMSYRYSNCWLSKFARLWRKKNAPFNVNLWFGVAFDPKLKNIFSLQEKLPCDWEVRGRSSRLTGWRNRKEYSEKMGGSRKMRRTRGCWPKKVNLWQGDQIGWIFAHTLGDCLLWVVLEKYLHILGLWIPRYKLCIIMFWQKMGWATFWVIFHKFNWDRCYDFLNIFAEKFSEKNGVFDSKQS
jgi:hypothetical protein